MTRRTFQPRIVTRPETLRIGDTIRVTWSAHQGLTRSVEGRIANREQHPESLTSYWTAEGGLLLNTIENRTAARITLLEPAPEIAQIGLW